MLYIIILAVGLGAGMLIMSYNKGVQSCSRSYEAKILKAKLKNQQIAIAYYRSGEAAAKQLAEKAKIEETQNIVEGTSIDAIIETDSDKSQCINDEFLRSLERIR